MILSSSTHHHKSFIKGFDIFELLLLFLNFMDVEGIRAVEGSCDGGVRFQRKPVDWWNVDRNGGR